MDTVEVFAMLKESWMSCVRNECHVKGFNVLGVLFVLLIASDTVALFVRVGLSGRRYFGCCGVSMEYQLWFGRKLPPLDVAGCSIVGTMGFDSVDGFCAGESSLKGFKTRRITVPQ